jgi:hypothetical protein
MDDDDTRDATRETEDDALEEDTRPDDIFNPDRDEDKLPEDNDPPAASPNPKADAWIQTHPVTDDNVDRDELYNEGLSESVGLRDTYQDSDDSPPEPLDPED